MEVTGIFHQLPPLSSLETLLLGTILQFLKIYNRPIHLDNQRSDIIISI